MPYLTGLARVARKTGYPVTEHDGWKKRGHGPMNNVQTIAVHHTAGPKDGDYPSLSTVRDGRPGLPGPLAQTGVGRSGTIHIIGAGLAYHAGAVKKASQSNPHAYGIELENTGTGQTWPAPQLDAAVKLCRAALDEFGLPINAVLGHKEICSPTGRKIDPAFIDPDITMAQFRGYVQRGYYTAPQPAKPTAPAKPATPTTPTAPAWPTVDLKVTTSHTAESDAAWRRLMADVGFKDQNLTTNMQRWLARLGHYKGLIEADHDKTPVFGPVLVKALQTFLRTKGLYSKAYLIDGKRQAATIRGEIRYLNTQAKLYRKAAA